ncbi:phosphate ABC transporter substrate-binding protein PstS [Comamonadaceae bacterium OH2545_COT-014]|nr:phosphate ABC transporter substrate-binding protein PstS [Comamonadaceae bacterium OH2545_COT-014]
MTFATNRRTLLLQGGALAIAGAGMAWGPAVLSQAKALLKGAGASLPALIYEQWALAYARETGAQLQYQASGSGEGVRQAVARSVHFGATDTPLAAKALADAKLVQFPTVVGGIVPVVNLPGVASGALRLDGPVLADLFTGRITHWNDVRIAALNPQLRLPALPVVRVVRADASGSTATFTRYLGLFSEEWRSKAGSSPGWNGTVAAARSTIGVVEAVQGQPGAVGYVPFDRVQKGALTAVALKNEAGQFVQPSELSIRDATQAANLQQNLTASLLNTRGAQAWPITELTYVLVSANPAKASDLAPTLEFFAWALQKGDAIVRQTGFVALPARVQAAAFKVLLGVRDAQGKLVLGGGFKG